MDDVGTETEDDKSQGLSGHACNQCEAEEA